MATPKHIADLILKSLRDELTDQEERELADWRRESEENEALFREVSDPDQFIPALKGYLEEEEKAWEKISSGIPELAERKVKTLPVWKIAVAASIILSIVSVLYFFGSRAGKVPNDAVKPSAMTADLPAGTNKAILTLANGSKIQLGSGKGSLANIGSGNRIQSLDSNLISYQPSAGHGSEILYNVLETPKGGQFQLSLPDGTKVWLNAASSIRYPVVFSEGRRNVEVHGEVYFEVAKNPAMPFVASANGVKVEVLGTHFNINAYDDEAVISTTLLEGSLRVGAGKNKKLLKPGEQARVGAGSDSIRILEDVNTDLIVAWKNGKTFFSGADVPSIMRIISRWYNVKIEYRGTIPQKSITGGISRNAHLSEVLKVLEAYGINGVIKDSTLIITR